MGYAVIDLSMSADIAERERESSSLSGSHGLSAIHKTSNTVVLTRQKLFLGRSVVIHLHKLPCLESNCLRRWF